MPIELLNFWWLLILGVIGFIGWLVRLEAKVLYLEKDQQHLRDEQQDMEKQMWTKIDTMQEQLVAILQATSNIEGYLRLKREKENGK